LKNIAKKNRILLMQKYSSISILKELSPIEKLETISSSMNATQEFSLINKDFVALRAVEETLKMARKDGMDENFLVSKKNIFEKIGCILNREIQYSLSPLEKLKITEKFESLPPRKTVQRFSMGSKDPFFNADLAWKCKGAKMLTNHPII
jgi:hypothetical protein